MKNVKTIGLLFGFFLFWVSVWRHQAKRRNFTRIKIHMGTW